MVGVVFVSRFRALNISGLNIRQNVDQWCHHDMVVRTAEAKMRLMTKQALHRMIC